MAGQVKVNQIQLGDSSTATQNFVWQTNVDGTCKLARGNVGATTQDILTVDAAGLVTMSQGSGRFVLGTAVPYTLFTTTTYHDLTGIPSWVKRITVILDGIGTNGTSPVRIQLGDSGGIENTGYVSFGSSMGVGNALSTTGFDTYQTSSTINMNSEYVFCSTGSNKWHCRAQHGFDSATINVGWTSGNKTLTGTLDRIRLTTVNGTDTFDAGSVNIMYEG